MSSQTYPALHLYPVDGAWTPKRLPVTSEPTKFARQVCAGVAPGEANGYFDSKVLSRQHAAVWYDGGKIFIKDTKSQNGTLLNGVRLSETGVESVPFELKNDDVVTMGYDVFDEDKTTILHHKVTARVLCAFSEKDYLVTGRAHEQEQAHL